MKFGGTSNSCKQALHRSDENQIGNRNSPNSLLFAIANLNGENVINQTHDQVFLNGSLTS